MAIHLDVRQLLVRSARRDCFLLTKDHGVDGLCGRGAWKSWPGETRLPTARVSDVTPARNVLTGPEAHERGATEPRNHGCRASAWKRKFLFTTRLFTRARSRLPQTCPRSPTVFCLPGRRLVGVSNQLLASLLARLAEVEARGLHRTRARSSLYTYCVYELRLSEGAAFRRVSAARLVRRLPALFNAIASGELHLTAVLMLGPHLTPENMVEVLARAKHRTKREIAQLVREFDPVPDVPARIEPLGPASTPGSPALRRPTWEMFVRSFNPVRHLDPGERPRDWMCEVLSSFANDTASAGDGSGRDMGVGGDVAASASALARCETESARDDRASESSDSALARNEPWLERRERESARDALASGPSDSAPVRNEPALARSGPELATELGGDVPSRAEDMKEVTLENKPPPAWAVGPERYSVQFRAASSESVCSRRRALRSKLGVAVPSAQRARGRRGPWAGTG
jgi:hypothetical protein